MLKTPLFSVLIPTKDRPRLVCDAIASVLLQQGSEQDFEVVVSNNGAGEETRRGVAAWRGDDRFLYLEPPSELSMPDHWEWASQRLKGEYVLILGDRLLLRQGALESLRELVSRKAPPEVISWPAASYSELSGATSNLGNDIDQIEEYSTHLLWEGLKQGKYFFSPALPRGFNSCVRRSVYDRIRRTRGRAFDMIAPDYSSAFSVLLTTDVVLHHGRPLTMQQGMHLSNGLLLRKGVETGYTKLFGSAGRMMHTPLANAASPILTTAVVYEDFFRTALAFGSSISWNEMNPVAFYCDCFREIAARHATSLRWNGALRRLRRNFAEAIEREGVERSRNIKRALRRSFPWGEFVRMAVDTWSPPPLLRFLRKTKVQLGRGGHSASALEAAGFDRGVNSPADETPMRRLLEEES